MAKKKAARGGSFRKQSTDDAVLALLTQAGGELDRRIILRRFGHRPDLSSALERLKRRDEIEVVAHQLRGARTSWWVRLIRTGGRK